MWTSMFGYLMIGCILGATLGYMLFHYRYGDAQQVDAMKKKQIGLQDAYESAQHDLAELNAQNKILKSRIERLIAQNEDYSRLISELSRYYFHIKEATQKVQELGKLLRVYDSNIDKKLIGVGVNVPDLGRSKGVVPVEELSSKPFPTVSGVSQDVGSGVSSSERKFF